MSEKVEVDIGHRGMCVVVYLFVVASENICLCGFVWTDRVVPIRMKFTLSKYKSIAREINTKSDEDRPLKSLLPSTVGPRA